LARAQDAPAAAASLVKAEVRQTTARKASAEYLRLVRGRGCPACESRQVL